jgi:tetratricopeptide (TPR) repeat protein
MNNCEKVTYHSRNRFDMKNLILLTLFFPLVLLTVNSCKEKKASPSIELINTLSLKKGQIISCGPTNEFGSANFQISCSEGGQEDFKLAVNLLHSFEYDEAEKAFAKVIDQEPGCAMAYWGVAMSNFHPLWSPPSTTELEKGSKAIQIAKSLKTSKRESEYIDAIAAYYNDWEKKDHRARCLLFENAMEKIHLKYPDDKEAAVFYALALNAAIDPADKTFAKQKKAGNILQTLFPDKPDHPGIAHYTIHTYDYPEIAHQGLEAARKYASIAPSSAHALHMPSHIFTRLGYWDECIESNLASVYAAKCYAEATGMKGHWDEELHGLDYLVYAYLQKGDNDLAKKQYDYLKTINEVYPANFKVAYAYAAIPSRYLLENRLWQEAAELNLSPQTFPWENYPWQRANVHFTRLMGSVHTNNLKAAENELEAISHIHDNLLAQKDDYKANQVNIQLKTAEAWINLKKGNKNEAIQLMQFAADLEDKTEKHPVTPGAMIPARELLGDMLMELNLPSKALEAYEANLKKNPNRFNALYGAGMAAEQSGNMSKAKSHFEQLLNVVGKTQSSRSELIKVKQVVNKTI